MIVNVDVGGVKSINSALVVCCQTRYTAPSPRGLHALSRSSATHTIGLCRAAPRRYNSTSVNVVKPRRTTNYLRILVGTRIATVSHHNYR